MTFRINTPSSQCASFIERKQNRCKPTLAFSLNRHELNLFHLSLLIHTQCFLLRKCTATLRTHTVYCCRQTHPLYYLQPLSIRGDLGDLVVDPVDEVCITGR